MTDVRRLVYFQAVCATCKWEGEQRITERQARLDAETHEHAPLPEGGRSE